MMKPVETVRRLSVRTPLRTKLITAVLGLVILALAAISIASVYMLRSYVTTQHDSQLDSYFSNTPSMTRQIQGTTPGDAGPYTGGTYLGIQLPGHQLSWMSFSMQNGRTITFTGPLPSLPTGAGWAGTNSPVLLTTQSLSGADTWRVMAQSIQDFPVSTTQTATVTVVLAIDLGNVDALTTRLILFDLIVGCAIVIVLAAVGVAAVQTNLRPLNDIEMTAGQIALGHLDHRVPEGDPRTEIGSLGRSLNAMLTQIESAFHAREASEQAAHQSEERMRRFIADASHELRTPLTTIRGFAAHYRQRGGANGFRLPAAAGSGSSRTGAAGSAPAGYSPGDDGLSPEDLDHLMSRVEAEATRMGLLVEDLLTLARLDQQRPITKAPVDLLTLAADAVQDARVVSPGRPIDLVVAPGTAFIVDGDEPRLRQVLGNLVNNALTHTPDGTAVRVKIGRGTLPAKPGAEPGAEPVPAVVLEVEDDGPGMSADQAQRVFERFYRADAARNRASGGTGLGLAIVAGLVAAHGGTVSVHTAPGEGADFQVRLPLSPDVLGAGDDPDEPDDELPA
jgi:two-component system OmpR family sensor kinase